MQIKKAKLILIRRAIERHPDQLLTYCGTKARWEDCFTEIESKKGKELIFWYNIGGGTFNEILILDGG